MAPRPQVVYAMSSHSSIPQESSNNAFSPSAQEETTAAVLEGVAAKPKESLYEELLERYDDEGDVDTVHTEVQASTIASEEDRKPAAKPREELLQQQKVYDDLPLARRRLEEVVVSSDHTKKPPPPMKSPPDEYAYTPITRAPTVAVSYKYDDDDDIAAQVKHFPTNAAATVSKHPPAPAPSHYQTAYNPNSMQPSFLPGDIVDDEIPTHSSHHQQQVFPDDSAVQFNFSETLPVERPKIAEPPTNNTKPTHEKISSFYESALQASGHVSPEVIAPPIDAQMLAEDERLALELSLEPTPSTQHPQDELLAQELQRRLELEERQRQQQQVSSSVACADASQLEILNKIRQEREQKLLEAALRESGGTAEFVGQHDHHHAIRASDSNIADYLLSQQLAMEEWQHVPRSLPAEMRRTSSSEQMLSNNSRGGEMMPHRVSMEYYTPNPGATTFLPPERSRTRSHGDVAVAPTRPAPTSAREAEIERGRLETQEAIANGRAHVVQCKGCHGRLLAPMSYAVVFCPKCETYSPGETYLARDDRLRRQRSKHGGNGRGHN